VRQGGCYSGGVWTSRSNASNRCGSIAGDLVCSKLAAEEAFAAGIMKCRSAAQRCGLEQREAEAMIGAAIAHRHARDVLAGEVVLALACEQRAPCSTPAFRA